MMTMNDYRGPFTPREGPLVAKAYDSQFAIGLIGVYGDGVRSCTVVTSAGW
jgi:hypothetical protein